VILIGIDAHKKSHTACAIGASVGEPIDDITVAANASGHEQLMSWSARLAPDRLWAVEDCRHVSGALERFLIGQGETLVRVPPKLMAGARRSARSPGKSDPIDARAIALAALREPGLPRATLAGEERDVRLLTDYRDQLVRERTDLQQRLRWSLHELCPDLEVPSRALDRGPWPGRVARRLRSLEPSVLVTITGAHLKRMHQLTKEIAELERSIAKLVNKLAPELLSIPGCGPLTAGKILGEVAGVGRLSTEAKLAQHAGVAPLPVSSGANQRHRLNRTGNRQLNAAIHRIAITQAARHEQARAFMDRKRAEGKTRREALRSLKRHLVRVVFNTLRSIEARRATEALSSST
jgi:transposase